jgi:nucleoside-diphosphate-sugar epimerase
MTDQRIMVLGATGFIGPAVLRRVVARGLHPIAVSRAGRDAGVREAQSLSVDRNDLDALSGAVRAVRPDAVIDLLAYTARQTLPLAARLAGRVNRYVMASSGDVYLQYDLLNRRAVGVPLAELTEQAPLRTRHYPYRSDHRRSAADPNAWMDEYDKIPIERGLGDVSGLDWSVLRLPMVYGPGDRNRRFGWAIGPMLSGDERLRIDAQWAAWRTSLGFVDDIAEALVLAAVHPGAVGQTFNAGPAEVKSNFDWALALSQACGWRGELQIARREETQEPTRSRLGALDLSVPNCMHTDLIRRTLGYTEVTRIQDALIATINAERETAEKVS